MMIGLLQRGWKQISSKGFCSLNYKPLHVCVVGSGPAGFYTAEKMLKAQARTQVDILDRLPTPFGLVRSGVAPDHPETKIVINQFSRVALNERCSFFGNVALGSDVNLSELREIYDVVVVAYGAESDRSLEVPGEDLMGIHSAREFVWWYNGHPDYHNMAPDLKSTDTAVVLGQGNVALDVARILLRSTSELQKTDIAEHALVSLHESTIRKVYLVGRRGPAQMACTAKELREILGVKDLQVHINEPDLVISSAEEDPLRAGGVCLEKTCLKENGLSGQQVAVGTGEFEELSCGLVLKSIGYKSLPVNGLPFDDYRGLVPNVKGRVFSSNQEEQANFEKGLYVVGWLKRGPTGIIGTNLYCAEETAASILEDLNNASASTLPKPGRKCLLQILESKKVNYVTFSGWEKIDAKEKFEGQLRNKPREKLTTWDELLQVAHHER